MRSRRAGAACSLLALLAAACASKPPVPPPPAAFFWEVRTSRGPAFYLLGSVHIGDGRELTLPQPVAIGWARSEELVVEVDTRDLSALEVLEVTQREGGFLPPGQALSDVLAPETYWRVVDYLRDHHYPLQVASRMRAWLLAQVVAQIEFEAAGYDADNGVDAWFLRRATGAKPVVQLESFEEQTRLFAGLPNALQETLLREILRETDVFLETTNAILRAWERGDEAMLLELLLGARDDPNLEAFHKRVFVDRNRVMAERLEALARDGRERFVVIGTGHLIGPDSVPELLDHRGFEVERLPDAFVRAAPWETPLPDPTAPAPAPEPEPVPAPAPAPAPAPP
jgi:uncharacterized protein YbaP (TraB family)